MIRKFYLYLQLFTGCVLHERVNVAELVTGLNEFIKTIRNEEIYSCFGVNSIID